MLYGTLGTLKDGTRMATCLMFLHPDLDQEIQVSTIQKKMLVIRRPDDWHVHFRDGDMMKAVVPYTARQFGRAIVMPNLSPPVTTADAARTYRDRILAAVPDGIRFEPLMTLYLTDDTDIEGMSAGFRDGIFTAAKLYPANATTNSAIGVSDVARIHNVLDRMQVDGMPLLVHGEVTDPEVDVFDREAVFIDMVMEPLVRDFSELKIVFEHVTTTEAVDFVRARHGEAPGCMGATITAHHLMINRTDIFRGGIRPHLYCLPIAKREKHRLALRAAAMSGEGSFFLGTDTAPHGVTAKETSCGCAGVFSAPVAMQVYAQAFDEDGKLDALEAFSSLNGPAFYGLDVNDETMTLEKADTAAPQRVQEPGGEEIEPFFSDRLLQWRISIS